MVSRKLIFIVSILSSFLAGSQLFVFLLLASDPHYSSISMNALSTSALLLTATYLGKLITSSSIMASLKTKPRHGLSIAFIGYFVASGFIYLSSHDNAAYLALIAAVFSGLAHSLANIETRTLATTSKKHFSLKLFTVLAYLGWMMGIIFAGYVSVFSNINITFGIISIIVFALSIVLFILLRGSKSIAQKETPVSNTITQEQTSSRGILVWILFGAFINTCLVTVFNSSIIVIIKKNLDLNNFTLSLVLAPLFLAGLLLLIPKLAKYIDSVPAQYLWQLVQFSRLLITLILITTTSIVLSMLFAPLFGLLMNLGIVCQLRIIRSFVDIEKQKLSHSLTEFSMVAAGVTISVLTSLSLTPVSIILILLGLLVPWSILSMKYFDRLFIVLRNRG